MVQSSQPPAPASQPSLPPNISIYTGPGKATLLSATIFTRLATTASDPKKLSVALSSTPSSSSPSWHQHQNAVLIFDGDDEDKEKLQDRHHEHFREVCLLLKEADIGVQYGRCVFDAGSALAAGFQLDKLGTGDVMVIDLQQMEDDAEDSDDEEDAKNDKEGGSDDESDSGSDIDLATLGDVVSGSLS